MLREVNPNANREGIHSTVNKPLHDDTVFLHTLGSGALPTPAKAAVVAIPPTVALAELDAVRQRLLVLVQGMSAWNALPPAAQRESYLNDPAGRDAFAKLRENEVLLEQCRILQCLQQQLSGDRSLGPVPILSSFPVTKPESLTSLDVNEISQPLPAIFAAPQMRPVPLARAESLRSSPLSALSGGDAGIPALMEDEISKPSDYPSFTSTSMASAGAVTTHSKGILTKNDQLSLGSMGVRRVPWPPQSDCVLAIIEFKRQRMKRCLCEAMVDPGKYVIVPGDRGYDCGLVVQCGHYNIATAECEADSLRTMEAEIIDPEELKGDMLVVTREATAEEIQQLYSTQASKERLALKRCRELVKRLNLDMNVVDCEYQFDGTKISFYFEASHAIDFRQLNKELYRTFNARIWLENVNNAVKNVVPEGAVPKGDKTHHRRNLLRAPSSS